MSNYIKDKEKIKLLRDTCEEIIKAVQVELKDFFTFQFKLIGSGEKQLITENREDGNFDLDYNLILQRDKMNLINKTLEMIFFKSSVFLIYF